MYENLLTKLTTKIKSNRHGGATRMAPIKYNPTGERFGRWRVLYRARYNGKLPSWMCVCDCGKLRVVTTYDLKTRHSESCGCFVREKNIGNQYCKTHGHTRRGWCSKTYSSWQGMIERCKGNDARDRKNYTERGITVCERWKSFDNFLSDMGERPEGKTIDRKNNDNGYYLENCRWATMKEQQNNRRNNAIIELNGERKTLMQWSEVTGISEHTLRGRRRQGWPAVRMLTEPPQIKNLKRES